MTPSGAGRLSISDLYSDMRPGDRAALRALLSGTEPAIAPMPKRRRGGKRFQDENRGQRVLELMAQTGCGHYTAAQRVCGDDLAAKLDAGASVDACVKRLARWYLDQERP